MKKYFLVFLITAVTLPLAAGPYRQPNTPRQHGKEEGMILDLNKISLA